MPLFDFISPIAVSAIFSNPATTILFVCSLLSALSVLIVCLAVFIDFSKYQVRSDQKKEKKSLVETGTMFLFFFLYYAIIRSGFGRVESDSSIVGLSIALIGTSLIVIGCIVNVRGRFDLGKNWSNQIKIYKDHTFIDIGVYQWVRHPLYASLIWMFVGGSLLYTSPYALLSTIFIFVPAMVYRAKQEECELIKEFPEYASYRKRVGLFFPKIFKSYEQV